VVPTASNAAPPVPGRARRRFLRRIGCLFGALFLLAIAVSVISFQVFGGHFDGSSGHRGRCGSSSVFIALFVVMTIAGASSGGRRAPIGD